jgi:hypothetical protein
MLDRQRGTDANNDSVDLMGIYGASAKRVEVLARRRPDVAIRRDQEVYLGLRKRKVQKPQYREIDSDEVSEMLSQFIRNHHDLGEENINFVHKVMDKCDKTVAWWRKKKRKALVSFALHRLPRLLSIYDKTQIRVSIAHPTWVNKDPERLGLTISLLIN